MSDQEIRQAYIEGFATKCAEYNVDPQVLAELVFEKDAQLGWMKRQAGKAYDAVANSPVGLGARMVMAKKDRLGGNMVEGALNAATNVASAANTGTMALGGAIHSGIKGGINLAQKGYNAAKEGINAAGQGINTAKQYGQDVAQGGLASAEQVGGGVGNVFRGVKNLFNQGAQNVDNARGAALPMPPPKQQVAQR